MSTAHFEKLAVLKKDIFNAPDYLRVETPTDVDQGKVDPLLYGHHRSVVVNRGDTRVRVWEFRSTAGIEKFKAHVERGLLRIR